MAHVNSRSIDSLRVLYIAGLPRSGSTVLGCVLGRLPGTIFVGELAFFWRRFAAGELCSCGKALPDCHFWSVVVGKAFGQLTREEVTELNKLEQQVVRRLRVLGVAPVRWSTHRAKRINIMLEERRRLYRSICEVANAEYIIDSGKEVTFGSFMTRLNNASFNTIHLVRDPRGVAFSWQKQVPSDSEPGDMPRSTAIKTAARWASNSLFIQFSLKRLSSVYLRVRYEDLVARPDDIAREISHATSNIASSNARAGHMIWLSNEHHLVGSNPGVRRNLGDNLRLKLDEEWRTQLPRSQQRLVTAVCGCIMAVYDYPLRNRRNAQGSRSL